MFNPFLFCGFATWNERLPPQHILFYSAVMLKGTQSCFLPSVVPSQEGFKLSSVWGQLRGSRTLPKLFPFTLLLSSHQDF